MPRVSGTKSPNHEEATKPPVSGEEHLATMDTDRHWTAH